ncbi:TetR family transcriptional regulator [Mycolicibacterium cosmeticum]|uniref:TetR family transcriptional regulator n=1 Tax=Mycolicibacterium cosmeticum TaxID=258533 RepID=UPI00046687C7
MPRPRVYDPDTVLDAVETLAVEHGPAAVTVRAVATAAGISNGALYHSFSSRSELLGRAWLRAGERFLQVQDALIEQAADPTEAVIAAAGAPGVLSDHYPASCRLVLAVRREDILDAEMPDELARRLRELQDRLVATMVRLADGLWQRRDRAAADTITECVVDLPTAILLTRDRLASPTARRHLSAAVRAVLDIGPPPPNTRKGRQP